MMNEDWTTVLSYNGRFGMRETFALVLIVLIALLGAAHILVRTSTYGAALGNDALNYLAAAESLAAGEGLGQMVDYAPFLSMALAFLSLFGIEPVDGGRFLNASAFGLLILVSGIWLSRRLKSPPIALGATAAVMVAPPLAHAASTLLSEPLFILFTLLALLPLESFLNRRSARGLVLSAVFAALAALTRYMGVALIFSGTLMLLSRRNAPVRERLKHALAFGAISSFPLAAALARNQLVSDSLAGDRFLYASGQSLFDSLRQIVVVFEGWADPLAPIHWQLQHSPWQIAGLVLLLAALLLITPRPGRASSVFWVFALLYLAIIAVVVPFTAHQGIDSRYLAPVYVPLLFVAVFWLDALLSKATCRMSHGRWALWAMVALVLVGGSWHIGVSVQQNVRLTAEALESGYIGKSFNTAYWEDSELVEYVRANPVSGQYRYYSNSPNVLRWNAGVPGTLVTWVSVPRRNLQKIYDCQRWFERAILISQQYGEPEARIVWVGQGERSSINCGLLKMESPLPLEPVAELADGAIFRLNAAFDNAGARQSAYESLVSGEPVIRSNFDVYLNENRLVYIKDPCARADTEAMFFLHLYPVDVNDLPDHRKQYGFDNLDFDFDGRGVIFDGRCMVAMALPEYDMTRIRTGQYVPVAGGFNNLWKKEFPWKE